MKKTRRNSFRNIISWLLTLSMLLGTMQMPEYTLTVQAGDQEGAGAVRYLDESGQEQTCESATILTGNETSLDPGWYVVNGDIVFHNSVILNGQGEYHIILADYGKMSIGTSDDSYYSEDSPVGLGCLYDDERKNGIKLNIYAQWSGVGNLGELYINNDSGSPEDRAMVGDAINVDELTINGGEITCYAGGGNSYGINTKKLTINGGSVEAFGNPHAVNCTGTVSMNGGSLKAEQNKGYAINCSGNIMINGGSITATTTGENGHGINSGEDITINGDNRIIGLSRMALGNGEAALT